MLTEMQSRYRYPAMPAFFLSGGAGALRPFANMPVSGGMGIKFLDRKAGENRG